MNSHRRQAIERGAGGAPLRDLGQRLLDASYLEGDFVLRSGRRSKFYLDKYLFSTRPDLLRDIAAGLAEKLPAYEPFDLLAGPELGAVAIVAAVSLACGKPFVIVRKGAKGYGTDKAMEGRAEPGQRVVMVEDVVTSGGAALMAADKLREADLAVRTLLCVVDREEGGREQIEARGPRLRPPLHAHFAGDQEAGVGAPSPPLCRRGCPGWGLLLPRSVVPLCRLLPGLGSGRAGARGVGPASLSATRARRPPPPAASRHPGHREGRQRRLEPPCSLLPSTETSPGVLGRPGAVILVLRGVRR